mmetsp:Transcript_77137/g.249713  ORF Transcript_77137/g.249713 Transcript_77137/m.249713 type:complete len:258 (+) Transcript_77137:616-1389(+)
MTSSSCASTSASTQIPGFTNSMTWPRSFAARMPAAAVASSLPGSEEITSIPGCRTCVDFTDMPIDCGSFFIDNLVTTTPGVRRGTRPASTESRTACLKRLRPLSSGSILTACTESDRSQVKAREIARLVIPSSTSLTSETCKYFSIVSGSISSGFGSTKLEVMSATAFWCVAWAVAISAAHQGRRSVSPVRSTMSWPVLQRTTSRRSSKLFKLSESKKQLSPVCVTKTICKYLAWAAASALWWQMNLGKSGVGLKRL